MPVCRNCGKRILKFYKDRCPNCGCEKPFDKLDDTTQVTQVLDQIPSERNLIKHQKISIYLFLLMIFGSFSIDLFYLKKHKLALLRLLCNVIFYVAIFLLIYLLDNTYIVLSLTLPLVILFFLYLIYGLFRLIFKKFPTNKYGVPLV